MGGPTLQDEGADDLKQKLVNEFGSVLEESLILAIVNERDVVKEHADIRTLLTELAESARTEQATGFDPSGLGSWAEIEGQASDGIATSGNCMSTENATTVSEFSDTEAPKFTHRLDLDDAEKLEDLQQIFSIFKEHTIRFVLKECGGDSERAFDELLTRQYLEQEGELPKGVDGFYVSDDEITPQKQVSGRVRNSKGKQKLKISYSVVSPTINDAELEGSSVPPLSPRTPRLPSSAQSSMLSSAGWQFPKTKNTPVLSMPLAAALPNMEASRSHLRSAASLNRQGPLGRQAASVYIQRSREEARKALYKTSAMAEQLVNQQSSSSKIDLHGVTVLDGVRIAKHRVWQWWDNLGEDRDRTAKLQGFTVITGVGRHSSNGVSRLRQAVGVALRNDGWKTETLTGQFYITGRASGS